MSSISGLGGASTDWANTAATRSGSRADRLFEKVDADGSGSVDSTELQTMLDKIGKITGKTVGDVAEFMKKADTDGDGTVSASERVAADLKTLLADLAKATSSTASSVNSSFSVTA